MGGWGGWLLPRIRGAALARRPAQEGSQVTEAQESNSEMSIVSPGLENLNKLVMQNSYG